ncbi:MAG TPA: peptidase S41, partial [Gammaproteobacteria bacterium]|nr:peptidase S41 [Gammaproteobacteria bacterium]MCH77475.1 peptidase S41 [Gammaproteobacteria bacterium]
MSRLLKASALLALGFISALALMRDGAHAERGEAVTTVDLPIQELRLFSEVLGIIRQNYVEPITDSDLLKSAIRGMLTGLDPHSAYLEDDEFQELKEGTSGEFGGLGIEVGMEDGFVKVISPIDDTPAQRAGIQAGDLVIRLDDTAVKGMSLSEAVKKMRGKPGTDITLTVVREGEERPLQITITRAIIKVNSVRSRTLSPGYGYLRVSQFQTNTGRKLREAVTTLKEGNEGGLKGLVLDLRNNPGGVLTAAVSVSDAFITQGLIVYTEGRAPEAEQKFSATSGDVLEGVPIVVLVNAGSASASEIVAGALQDNGRAIIMGEKTFGKGSVQ